MVKDSAKNTRDRGQHYYSDPEGGRVFTEQQITVLCIEDDAARMDGPARWMYKEEVREQHEVYKACARCIFDIDSGGYCANYSQPEGSSN
ncbi:hypothetical protein AC579_7383 [Pseudocercospora musae]|uniref:Uncharacterized protein n=1 Tax=Pseudocercospora musae TaxID=113226 RepID=A0A139ICY7_9PEZI|nr:hypothetical protein AC579_7383 [Pseudocercospora musae]